MLKKVLLAFVLGGGGYLIWRYFNPSAYVKTDNNEGGFFTQVAFDASELVDAFKENESLQMNFSVQLLDYLKSWEAFSPKVYVDEAGFNTIGYGHKIVASDGFKSDSVITEIEATGLLLSDIAAHQIYVNRYVKIPLKQNQFDALVSFVFNAGPASLKKVAETVNKGGDVPAHLLRYVKGGRPLKLIKGLYNRRVSEIAIWNLGLYKRTSD